MACQDAAEQGLLTQVGDEVAGDRIFLLQLILTVDGWQSAIVHGTFVAPETHGGPPDIIGEERHMHA